MGLGVFRLFEVLRQRLHLIVSFGQKDVLLAVEIGLSVVFLGISHLQEIPYSDLRGWNSHLNFVFRGLFWELLLHLLQCQIEDWIRWADGIGLGIALLGASQKRGRPVSLLGFLIDFRDFEIHLRIFKEDKLGQINGWNLDLKIL